jgi:hypothetical protein
MPPSKKEVMVMKLLTKELEVRFLELGSQEEIEDPIVICKFFNPVGAATWFITEIVSYRVEIEGDLLELEPYQWHEARNRNLDCRLVDVIFFGFASLFGPPYDELGYVSLCELESVRLPLGLAIERDIYWSEIPLSLAKRELPYEEYKEAG